MIPNLELDNRRRSDSPPGQIEATTVRMVAVRGDARDWAAYYMTFAELDREVHISSLCIASGEADPYIIAHGHKLDRTAARFQLFPNVKGEYRD